MRNYTILKHFGVHARRENLECIARIACAVDSLCKAEIYKKVQKFRNDANNKWESYDGYDYD